MKRLSFLSSIGRLSSISESFPYVGRKSSFPLLENTFHSRLFSSENGLYYKRKFDGFRVKKIGRRDFRFSSQLFLPKKKIGELLENGYPKHTDKYINDFSEIISNRDYETIHSSLLKLDKETEIEFTVVTIASVRDYPVEENKNFEAFCTKLFNTWGVGDKGRSDGVMILVAYEDRATRIELGRGFPPVLNRRMKDVINRKMIPYFKTGNFSGGIASGVENVIRHITTDDGGSSRADEDLIAVNAFLVIFVSLTVAAIIIYKLTREKKPNKKSSFFHYDDDDDDDDDDYRYYDNSSSSYDSYDSSDYDDDYGGGSSDGGGASGTW